MYERNLNGADMVDWLKWTNKRKTEMKLTILSAKLFLQIFQKTPQFFMILLNETIVALMFCCITEDMV